MKLTRSVLMGAFLVVVLYTIFTLIPKHNLLADTSSVSVTVAITECSDSIDNDGDSLVDYPNDPDCDNPSDDDESTPPEPEPEPEPEEGTTGGGGGGGVQRLTDKILTTSVSFSGYAYPRATIQILRNGVLFKSLKSDSLGRFSSSNVKISPGVYTFSVIALGGSGERSLPMTFTVSIPKNRSVFIGEIYIPPTISLNPSSTGGQQNFVVSGLTVPNTQIEVLVGESIVNSTSDDLGNYQINLNNELATREGVLIKARANFMGKFTGYSSAISLASIREERKALTGDINSDGSINLVDFSILAFWYRKTTVSPRADLNKDGIVDLKDLSILAYYWTG